MVIKKGDIVPKPNWIWLCCPRQGMLVAVLSTAGNISGCTSVRKALNEKKCIEIERGRYH